jgi:hypothetical protein
MKIIAKTPLRVEQTDRWAFDIKGRLYEYDARWINGALDSFHRVDPRTNESLLHETYTELKNQVKSHGPVQL